jgi:Ca2+-binding RTX toxin-like protein
MPTITHDSISPISLDESGTVLTIAPGVVLDIDGGAEYGIHEVFGVSNNVINVRGLINAPSTTQGFGEAILSEGLGTKINIAHSGTLLGDYGVIIRRDDAITTNSGQIVTDQFAYSTSGEHSTFINNGFIKSHSAVEVAADDFTFKNGADGNIVATDTGLIVDSGYSLVTIINHGTFVTRGENLISSNDGKEHIVNDGVMHGWIMLGGGDDIYDGRGGKLNGVIGGGDGDDTVYVSDPKTKYEEAANAGTDTVKSMISYTLGENVENLKLIGKGDSDGVGSYGDNEIHGNIGNNRLYGLTGVDQLAGGKGNDILTGGSLADTFVYSSGDGKDRITDFAHGEDHIGIFGFGSQLDSWSELQSHMTQHDANHVWITLPKGVLVLDHVSLPTLDSGDFVFDH